MRILRVLLAFVLVVAGVVSTVGSGGGGGGSSSGGIGSIGPINLAPGPQPDIDITSANAQDVSATVLQAIDQLFDLTVVIGGQVFPSPPAAPDLLPGNSKFKLFVTEETAPGNPIESLTETCAVSGTVTVLRGLYNDMFNDVSVADGDIFDLVFDSCDDGDGYTLDGGFMVEVRELEGDLRTDVFRLRYSLRDMNLTVTSGMNSYVASVLSSTSIYWDSLAFPVVVLTAQSANQFLSSQADDYSWSSGDHSLTVNADISIPETLAEARESLLESAVLGGYVSYEIIVPLQAPDGQDPESGEILISGGDGNGTIRIVIESSASVRLEIDADGDGNVDDYQYTTWAALQG
jgi:hypothetical protein